MFRFKLKHLIHILSSGLAIYLSFKINNGFSFVSFIISWIFPYIYILYVVAIHGLDIIWNDLIHKEDPKKDDSKR